MFIAALFIIARTWKQPRCPSADEWIRTLVHIHHGVSLTVLFISAGPGDQWVDRRLPWKEWVLMCSVPQSRPVVCNPMDYGPPGSSVHGVFQARMLEWVPFPPPEDLPDPGIEPGSPVLQADSLPFKPQGSTFEYGHMYISCNGRFLH